MDIGEIVHAERMSEVYGEDDEIIRFDFVEHKPLRAFGDVELAESSFYGDFPTARHGEEYFVALVGEYLARFDG